MPDNDSFAENPFRALKVDAFPDAKKASAANTAGTRVARASGKAAGQGANGPNTQRSQSGFTSFAQAPSAGDDAETELFLQAVSRVTPRHVRKAGKGRQAGPHEQGFTLEDHGQAVGAGATAVKSGQPVVSGQAVKNRQPAKPEQPVKSGSAALSGKGAKVGQYGGAGMPQTKPTGSSECMPPLTQAFHEAQQDPDDAEIFLRALGKEVAPLQARGREVPPAPPVSVAPPSGDISLQDFMEGRLEFALSFTDEYIEGHVVGLDQMIMNKLRAGSLSPEAHLDLHGLNAEQAFEAVRGFFRGSWYKGLRTVLVVPGRGRNSPDGQGILREKLQNWLTQEPFKRVVLAFCTAQPHDGGAGSVYVLLRKYRKKGRICWERMPADADFY